MTKRHLEMHVRELRPGDLLLAYDSSPISTWIRRLDRGRYSHVAIWDGTSVLEASGNGGKIRARDIEMFILEHDRTDVYRFSREGRTLGDPGWSVGPIIDVARSYLGSAYPYGDLCLLGVLVALGRATGLPAAQELFRRFGSQLTDAMRELGSQPDAKKPMTCSEFVSLAFWEADPTPARRYVLLVTDEPSRVMRPSVSALARDEQIELSALIEACARQLLPRGAPRGGLWRRDPGRGHRGLRAMGAASVTVRAGDRALPASCVTPRDLERSSTLSCVGEVMV